MPSKVNLLIALNPTTHGGTLKVSPVLSFFILMFVLGMVLYWAFAFPITQQLEKQNELLEQIIENQEAGSIWSDSAFPNVVAFPDDLQPGTQVHTQDQMTLECHNYTVMSVVYEMPRGEDKGGMMEVVELQGPDGTTSTLTLAELGILPYPNGTWHPHNITFFGACPNQA